MKPQTRVVTHKTTCFLMAVLGFYSAIAKWNNEKKAARKKKYKMVSPFSTFSNAQSTVHFFLHTHDPHTYTYFRSALKFF